MKNVMRHLKLLGDIVSPTSIWAARKDQMLIPGLNATTLEGVAALMAAREINP